MVKNPPANVGDTGPILDLGRSHVPQSKCTTTIEPVLKSPVAKLLSPHEAAAEACALYSPRSTTREAQGMRSPHSTTGVRPLLSTTRGKKPAQQ